MSAQRLIGVALLLSSAACASRTGTRAPKPMRGDDGPRASLQVRYSGGLLYRTVDASFRVNEYAHVIVGHLGGDGVIRVLYPTNPLEVYRSTPSNRTVAVKSFTAAFDGAPSAFSLARSPFRNTSAMMDSYDGRGHGFVFMIATRMPMDVDAITDGFEWDEIDAVDYMRTTDPRHAIQEFAEMVTRGGRFTLRFANSFTTQSFATYASNAYDCSVLSGLGYGHLGNFWGSWGLGGLSFLGYGGSPYSTRSGCGGHRYYAQYDNGRQYAYVPYIPRGSGPTLPPPPNGPITPTLTRPTQRPRGEASRAVLVGRSVLDRPSAGSTRASALQRRPSTSSRDGDSYRPSTRVPRPSERPGYDNSRAASRADRPGARAVDGPRSASPRSDTPRSSSPSPSTEARHASPSPPRSSPAATSTKSTTSETKHQ